MSDRPKSVVIVGAGLAGLACAYELTKTGEYQVTVLETNDYPGGRVRTLPVNGRPVDFGGFIIYPWYSEFHRLIRELGLHDHHGPIAWRDVYYELYNEGQYVTAKQLHFPWRESAGVWGQGIFDILFDTKIDQPKLKFHDQTFSAYIRQRLGRTDHGGLYETYADIVSQGYCYGPVDQFRMAFAAPFIRQTNLGGDLRVAAFFPHGTGQFPEALAAAITKAGGEMRYNTTMTGFNQSVLLNDQAALTADAYVFAQRVQKPIFEQIIPDLPVTWQYTHFYTVTVQVSAPPSVNEKKNWGAVFYKPKPKQSLQVLSAINIAELYYPDLAGYINLNIRILPTEPLELATLHDGAAREVKKIFPDVECTGVVQTVHWPQTMPVATEPYVQSIRERQGQNNLYFAGDFLGAPSMETALRTGVQAAKLVQLRH